MSNKNHPLVAETHGLVDLAKAAAFEIDKATTGEGNKAAARRYRKLMMAINRLTKDLRVKGLPFTKSAPEPAILPTDPTPPTNPEVSE
jgi:hypothetical protein